MICLRTYSGYLTYLFRQFPEIYNLKIYMRVIGQTLKKNSNWNACNAVNSCGFLMREVLTPVNSQNSFFIQSGHFYSASSRPLLLRSFPDTARIRYRSFTLKRHRQLWVEDLPKVLTWRIEYSRTYTTAIYWQKQKGVAQTLRKCRCEAEGHIEPVFCLTKYLAKNCIQGGPK